METQVEEKGYNGWKNYETWAVKLWLDNDRASYEYTREMVDYARTHADDHPNVNSGIWSVEEAVRFSLADQLRQEVEENMPDLGASMYADLLNASMSEVDWDEIAENILSES